jgi:hypothetical protein
MKEHLGINKRKKEFSHGLKNLKPKTWVLGSK